MLKYNKYRIALQTGELPKENIKCMAINNEITLLVICVWRKIYIYNIDLDFQLNLLQEIQDDNLLIDIVQFLNQKNFITGGYEIIFWEQHEVWYSSQILEFEERTQQVIFNQKNNFFIASFKKSVQIYEDYIGQWILSFIYQSNSEIDSMALNENEKVLIIGENKQGILIFQKYKNWLQVGKICIDSPSKIQLVYITNFTFLIYLRDICRNRIIQWNFWSKKKIKYSNTHNCKLHKPQNINTPFCINFIKPLLTIKKQNQIKLIQINHNLDFEIFEKFKLKSETNGILISQKGQIIIFWNMRGRGVEFWILK